MSIVNRGDDRRHEHAGRHVSHRDHADSHAADTRRLLPHRSRPGRLHELEPAHASDARTIGCRQRRRSAAGLSEAVGGLNQAMSNMTDEQRAAMQQLGAGFGQLIGAALSGQAAPGRRGSRVGSAGGGTRRGGGRAVLGRLVFGQPDPDGTEAPASAGLRSGQHRGRARRPDHDRDLAVPGRKRPRSDRGGQPAARGNSSVRSR